LVKIWQKYYGRFMKIEVPFICILYNQRDATYTEFFIIISARHVSGGFSAQHQGLMKLCAALGIVLLSRRLPLLWIGRNCSADPQQR
jgi:hypothetical protein